MNQKVIKISLFILIAVACSLPAFGQGGSGAIVGTVKDTSGSVVPGVDIVVKNDATGQEFKAVSTDTGIYSVPIVPVGLYTVTATLTGFKQAIVKNVQVNAATPATVNVTMEIGVISEQVVVTGGAEVLQTQSANVSTTVVGRQITELPFTSRDALDLVLLLPGTTTPGRPRSSTINGLPRGSLNISIDGVNVQDNVLKSDDGFFTYIRPRIDAVEEVTVSTATPGAESSAEGAVQVKFVTRQGTNAYHGSLYEYYRSPGLNANPFILNRDQPKLCEGNTKACREKIILHQPGGRVGGPISIPGLFSGKDRAFFFVNYEEFRLPEATARTRTILSPDAQNGIFKYNTSAGLQSVNLLQLAAANGQTTTVDPTVGKLLSDIRASASGHGNITDTTDPEFQYFSFTNVGGQVRRFPTVRFDFNLTPKHHLENTWNYQSFNSTMDFLNSADPAFPGFPGYGSQISNRFSNTIALRSTLTSRIVNEARFGLNGGTVVFFPEIGPPVFKASPGNMDGYALNINDATGLTNAYVNNGPSRRNSPVKQFTDTLNWTKGVHNFSFGFNFSQINMWSTYYNYSVPEVILGMDSTDPASAMFTTANFPNASTTNTGQAAALYAVLTGRVTGIYGQGIADENTGKYVYNGPATERGQMREMGMFAQDSWRMKSNLTLNYGLRWEVQFPFTTLNNFYSWTTFDQLYGVSGKGNLFKPGTLTGQETQFVPFKPGDQAFSTKWNNFAPTFGFAWTPGFREGVLRKLFGSGTQSVFRGGYSIAFNREGMNVLSSLFASNPGGFVTADKDLATGNLGDMPVLFRDKSRLTPPDIPATATYPQTGAITDSANAFDPSLRLGYVQSWTFGWQRELTKDTVLEFRYVGNHGTKLWRQYNLNETNIIENGMYDEFRLAMANLQANIAAGGSRNGSFAYFGPGTGTSPLPITLAYLNGKPASAAGNASSYTGSSWKSTSWVNYLFPGNPAPLTYAANLHSAASRRANAANAGLPANFFWVNPGKRGGAWTVDNGGNSTYNAMTIELRRRLSKGLLAQGSYSWAKGLTNEYGSSSAVAYSYASMRETGLNKTLSPWSITHSFKVNWIYELPVGKGKPFFNNMNGFMDRVFGGWEMHGEGRIQSGAPINLGNVQLVGMTVDDLRNAVQIRQDPSAGITYYLPQDIIDNTRKAFNVTAKGYSLGTPTGRYIAPANTGGCIGRYTGECGYAYPTIFGARFVKFDISAVKRIWVTEGTNFEIRGEFLNAFNNKNLMVQSPNNSNTTLGSYGSATFGQTRNYYRDTSTTNDPGSRMIQLVARFNF